MVRVLGPFLLNRLLPVLLGAVATYLATNFPEVYGLVCTPPVW